MVFKPKFRSRSAAIFTICLLATGLTAADASAKSTAGKPELVQPGTPFVGWGKLGDNDWPVVGSALIVRPVGSTLTIRSEAKPGSKALNLVAGTSVSGDLGLLAVGETNDWWKVLLPVRPNGTVGWVQKSTAKVQPTAQRIVIDLSTNTLTYFDGAKQVLTEPVATGTNGTPTPTGLFFVKSIVAQKNPVGGLGPWVLVTSGFSNALFSFAGGSGAVGIHGTSAPGKLGQNVSHGCVRMKNTAIVQLAAAISAGVPIEIVAKPADLQRTRWEPTKAQQTGPSTVVGSNGQKQPTTTVDTPAGSGVEVPRPPITALP